MLAVLLAFEDEDAALSFVNRNSAIVDVKGVYKVPTLFCEETHGKRLQGFTQGQRWGWWVCGVCKRPKKTAYLYLWEYMPLLGYDQTDKLVQEGKLVAFPESNQV